VRAIATAVAALVAKASSSAASSSPRAGGASSRSSAARTPSRTPRYTSGTTSAAAAPAIPSASSPARGSSGATRVLHPRRELPGGRGDRQAVVVLGEQQHHRARADERPATLHHELEDPGQLELAAERPHDGGGRLEPPQRALGVLPPALRVREQPRVLHRDRRPVGQEDDGLLVGLRERPARSLGEVQVAPALPADDHRDAEEAAHGRMVRGKAEGRGVPGDVLQAQWPRVVDEHAEHATPVRRSPIRRWTSGSIPCVRNRSSRRRSASSTPIAA
jgi:hypothetical protein